MSQHNRFAVSALAAAIGASALITAPSAHALRGFVNLWQLQYPASLSDDNVVGTSPDEQYCALCHNDTNLGLNPYGQDWRDAWGGTTDPELIAALVAIEGVNSDADPTGSSNIVEINADTQPGWAEGSNPVGIVGLLDPDIPPPPGCAPFVSPAVVDFGIVAPGDTAIASTTVTNNGDTTCDGTATVFDESGEFALESPAGISVDPQQSVAVDVSYTPLDETADTGRLALEFPDEIVNVQLIGAGGASVDLDIKSFRVTNKVSLTRGKGIVSVDLTVDNGGLVEGVRPATVTGVQNGVPVYVQTVNVTDGVGNGSTRYSFQSYIPTATGDIEWTAEIADSDPDDDTATATTTVDP
jgi:hypothetical protein